MPCTFDLFRSTLRVRIRHIPFCSPTASIPIESDEESLPDLICIYLVIGGYIGTVSLVQRCKRDSKVPGQELILLVVMCMYSRNLKS